jgi:hypothetical protein
MAADRADMLRTLNEVADTIHEVAMAMTVRSLLLRGNITLPLKESLQKQQLTDAEVRERTVAAFEKIVLLRLRLGDPAITLFECGKEDMTP